MLKGHETFFGQQNLRWSERKLASTRKLMYNHADWLFRAALVNI
jgi:hypothetical protein